MGLRDERIAYKPFEYQWAYDYWFNHENAHWMHHKIGMMDDIRNWNEDLSEKEKNVIANILKGFAQTELEVEDYWSTYVTEWFRKPEIRKMAIGFAARESIHAEAYSYLNETLGLTDFDAFMKDEVTMKKLELLMEVNKSYNWYGILRKLPDWVPFAQTIRDWAESRYDKDKETEDIARSIALFSACAEGIQLFSSFAVMLSFRPSNRMKGISQQMVYSIKDESLHSEAGCRLFRELIAENPGILTKPFKASVYEGINLALENEFDYIDKIFELGDLETITKDQLKNFMYDRANRKIAELGLSDKPTYPVEEKLLNEMSWFYSIVGGVINGDFFDIHQADYAEPNSDWNDSDAFDF